MCGAATAGFANAGTGYPRAAESKPGNLSGIRAVSKRIRRSREFFPTYSGFRPVASPFAIGALSARPLPCTPLAHAVPGPLRRVASDDGTEHERPASHDTRNRSTLFGLWDRVTRADRRRPGVTGRCPGRRTGSRRRVSVVRRPILPARDDLEAVGRSMRTVGAGRSLRDMAGTRQAFRADGRRERNVRSVIPRQSIGGDD